MLKLKDKSAQILAQYIPPAVQPGFVGLRSFNQETTKIVDTSTQPALGKVKLEFWKSQIQKIFTPNSELLDPTSKLLHQAVYTNHLQFHKKYLLTMVQTQQHRLERRPLRTIESMEQYGEGVYSQMNYALFDMLQTKQLQEYLAANPDHDSLVTDTLAHVGQANGIASLLRGFEFYISKQNYVNLPLSELQVHKISEQQLLDGDRPAALSDVVFTVATRANDHVLTAKSLMRQFKEETKLKLPNAVVLPAMSCVPIEMYLEHLERANFDLAARVKSEWKLPWRTWTWQA